MTQTVKELTQIIKDQKFQITWLKKKLREKQDRVEELEQDVIRSKLQQLGNPF